MNKIIALSALALMFALSVSNANAWTRNATVSGPNGTATIHGSGSCANGTCSRSVTVTGPYGNTARRQGSVTCANGVCSGSRTTTGWNGNTVYRQGAVYR